MAVKIALCYGLLSGLCILCFGFLVHYFVRGNALEALLESLEAWVFISVTAILLALALDRYFREIRRSAQLLQDSEQRAQFAIEGAGHAVWDWNAPTNEVFYSARWKTMLGFEPHEIGNTLAEWHTRIHPEDLPRVQEEIQRHFDGQSSAYACEYRIRCKDGSFNWLLDQGKVMSRMPDGKPLRVLGTCSDVTERKQADAALRESLLFRREAEKISRTGAWKVSPKTDYLYWTEGVYEIVEAPLDYKPGLEEGMKFYDPESIPVLREALGRALQDGTPFVKEVGLTTTSGKHLCTEVRGLRRLVEGEHAFVMGTFQDITPRKQAEQAVRESEERFRALVENAPNGIFVQVDGKFAYINDSAARLFGPVPRSRLLGLPVLERFHTDQRAQVMERIRLLNEERRAVPVVEERCLRLDGAEFDAEFSAVPFDYDGRSGALVFFHDITERKRLEAQFRQAQKLDAIGQLAGGVAHDFNNILAAIMMNLGLLQMNPKLDPETQQALKELDDQARRAAGLTQQLLMFSRRSVLAVKPLDLNEVVANLLKMLHRLIGEHIDLRFDGKSALPLVAADTGMLDQVLMNLVVNARDAMPRGGRITISTSLAHLEAAQAVSNPDRRTGRFVCLTVLDTGCGMDAATLKRIFEPFFTTKEAGKGTGLGLATVHGIVAQHKGWLEVESQPGQGSTFRVFLPALAQSAAQVPPSPPVGPAPRGSETILLVEDDGNLRLLTGRSLRALGYRVYEAENGQAAMVLWQTQGQGVDLVLTDMVMPEGVTGLELTERMQALKPGLKVIIASGYSTEIVQAGVPAKAGVVYLPKPYSTNFLADTVRKCLDRKS